MEGAGNSIKEEALLQSNMYIYYFCTIPAVLRTSNTSLILVVGALCTWHPACLLSLPELCADLSPKALAGNAE